MYIYGRRPASWNLIGEKINRETARNGVWGGLRFAPQPHAPGLGAQPWSPGCLTLDLSAQMFWGAHFLGCSGRCRRLLRRSCRLRGLQNVGQQRVGVVWGGAVEPHSTQEGGEDVVPHLGP